jgi:SAM-dependent methyltransferase
MDSGFSERDLQHISRQTIAHYNGRADQFRAGTQDHDVSQNQAALLRHIRTARPWRLLDFGCGPGRDLQSFSAMGYEVIGLDGAEHFCTMARESSGCEVWQQDFLSLSLPTGYFDGIFANASLFHVPSQELPRVLRQLYDCLKPDGALLSSNPHGDNHEGWQHQRYASLHRPARWQAHMETAGFVQQESYYRPAHLPPAQRPWFVSVWLKPTR